MHINDLEKVSKLREQLLTSRATLSTLSTTPVIRLLLGKEGATPMQISIKENMQAVLRERLANDVKNDIARIERTLVDLGVDVSGGG